MESIEAVIGNDRFGRHSRIEMVAIGQGTAQARMTLGLEHLNGLGMVHGGAIFTLADCAFAAACNSTNPPSVAINASISYVKAAKGAVLLADAQEIQQAGKLGTCLVRITDEDGDVVATFHGLSYRKGPPRKPA